MTQPQTVDLRAAARALLAGEQPCALALRPEAFQRILQVANAEGPVLAERPALEARRGGDVNVRGGVAVVALQGILTPRGSFLSLLFGDGPGGLQGFRRDLAAAMGSSDVDAIVLDVHSPGGVIGLVPETAAELRDAAGGDKPIVACVNTMCASAAYWIAAQADEVAITPSGLAGSIGVYVVHEDWSGWNEQRGIDPTYVHAGRFKVEGNFDEPLSQEARDALQLEVDDLYDLFLSDVAAGRGTTADAVRNGYGEGRVLPADRAVAAGLADRVATIDETIRELSGGARRGRSRTRAEEDDPAGGDRRRTGEPSDEAASLRGADDTPPPNETPVSEEVAARIAELRESPVPTTL